MAHNENAPKYDEHPEPAEPSTREAPSEGDPGPPEMEYFEKGRVVPTTEHR